MAKIGMKKPKYSVITETVGENGVVSEAYSAGKVFAKAISANTSLNVSKVKLYADDGLAEEVAEFISGQLSFAADDIETEVEADITGAEIDEETGAIINKESDTAKSIRLGFIVQRIKNNVRQYRAVIFAKIKFDTPADDYETKGETVAFKSAQLAGEIMRNAAGEWRIRSKWLPTEAEAEAFLDANIAPKNV